MYSTFMQSFSTSISLFTLAVYVNFWHSRFLQCQRILCFNEIFCFKLKTTAFCRKIAHGFCTIDGGTQLLGQKLNKYHFLSTIFARMNLALCDFFLFLKLELSWWKAFWIDRSCKRKFAEGAESHFIGLRKVFWRIGKMLARVRCKKMEISKGTKLIYLIKY